MTADAPKRRGRPLKPLDDDPFAAPSFDEERRKRWADLVAALAKVKLPRPVNGRHLLGEALAERMFPTDEWPRYTVLHDPPGRGAVIRNADGRGQEAVDRWLRSRTGPEPIEARIPEHKMEKPRTLPKSDLPWLQSIATAQRAGEVRQWGERHRGLAERLEAFAAAPDDPALAEAATEALGKLPPEPKLPDQAPLKPDPERPDPERPDPEREPDPERLTRERLRKAPGGDPGERDATAAVAKELAAECRRVAADVKEWLKDHNTIGGKRPFARAVAVVVADLFVAAGAGEHVRFAKGGGAATGSGPANAYCRAVEAALEALGVEPGEWRRAAEAVSRMDRSRSRPLIRSAI